MGSKGIFTAKSIWKGTGHALSRRIHTRQGQRALAGRVLLLRNPGRVTVGTAGYSSTRNQHLADIMESTPYENGFVAENRGTGFKLMRQELESN